MTWDLLKFIENSLSQLYREKPVYESEKSMCQVNKLFDVTAANFYFIPKSFDTKDSLWTSCKNFLIKTYGTKVTIHLYYIINSLQVLSIIHPASYSDFSLHDSGFSL